MLNQIIFIENQISDLDTEIHGIYNTLDSFLTSIPDIGDTLAPVILAEIGDIENFDSPNKLVAFAGIDSSSNQSGNSSSANEKTSKRGSPYPGVQRKLLGIIWAVLSENRPYRPYN